MQSRYWMEVMIGSSFPDVAPEGRRLRRPRTGLLQRRATDLRQAAHHLASASTVHSIADLAVDAVHHAVDLAIDVADDAVDLIARDLADLILDLVEDVREGRELRGGKHRSDAAHAFSKNVRGGPFAMGSLLRSLFIPIVTALTALRSSAAASAGRCLYADSSAQQQHE